jgi:protein subunit release factor A
MKLVIMPGEGGKDAQLLARDLYNSYVKALDG